MFLTIFEETPTDLARAGSTRRRSRGVRWRCLSSSRYRVGIDSRRQSSRGFAALRRKALEPDPVSFAGRRSPRPTSSVRGSCRSLVTLAHSAATFTQSPALSCEIRVSDWLEVFRAWIDSADNQRSDLELSPDFARHLLERLESLEELRSALRIDPSAGFAGRLLDRLEAAQQLAVLLPTLMSGAHGHLRHRLEHVDHCDEEPCRTARSLLGRLTQ